jgi:hypothetical protein
VAERGWLIGGILILLVCWWLLLVEVAKLLGVVLVVGKEMRSVMEFT